MQDIAKYGGYNKVAGAYFALVEHTDKKKRVRSIEYVPIAVANEVKHNKDRLDKYFIEQGLKEHRILIPKIKIETLFEINGARVHLTGRSDSALVFKHAIQFVMGDKETRYTKELAKRMNSKKLFGSMRVFENGLITTESNLELYIHFANKIDNSRYGLVLGSQKGKLEETKDRFQSLSLEEQLETLFSILQFFQCNRVLSNLSLLRLGSQVGMIRFSKNISNWESGKIIHQSITGLFEQEVDLFKI